MAASQRSLRVTELYRQRLLLTRARVERDVTERWRALMPEDLDGGVWIDFAARTVAAAQTEATRATSGYLAAFLTSELGRSTAVLGIDSRRYAGLSRDGRPLAEALSSPIIGTKATLGEGRSTGEAIEFGLLRAKRMVELDTMHAARTALLDAIDADDRFDGWRRAVRGTCGACAGAAAGVSHGLSFPVHPGCQCVSEPNVRDVPNRFPRPSGAEIFAAKSRDEQDEMLGPESADLVRSGAIELSDLVAHSPLDSDQPNFITQRPVSALQ